MDASNVLSFSQPPINEVVYGAVFKSNFSPVHYGSYWKTISDRYPRHSAQPPVILDNTPAFQQLPLPRAWFEGKDETRLIQLQSDRFYFNWRQRNQKDIYPHFATLFPEFQKEFVNFEKWAKQEVENFEVSAFELSYIDHLDKNSGWFSPKDNHKLLKVLPLNSIPSEWSPTVSVASLSFQSPSLGNMYLSAKQGTRAQDGAPVLVVDITVRSSLPNPNPVKWFTEAHAAVNKVFISMTTEEAQKMWGLSKPKGSVN